MPQNLREKIELRMKTLEKLMNSNRHLEDPELINNRILSVSKFWPILSEEDRDYIQACQWAVQKKRKWK